MHYVLSLHELWRNYLQNAFKDRNQLKVLFPQAVWGSTVDTADEYAILQ